MTQSELLEKIKVQFKDSPDYEFILQWSKRVTDLEDSKLAMSVINATTGLLIMAAQMDEESMPLEKIKEIINGVLLKAERKEQAKYN